MKNRIRVLIILMVSFCIVALERQSDIVQAEFIPGASSRLQLVSVYNGTEDLEFQIYPALKESVGLVLPMGTLHLSEDKDKAVMLDRAYPLIIRCSKGSYRPVFIQDGYGVSGKAPEGYDGPFCVSMWLPYPFVADSSKMRISYVVKKGALGKIGIKIGPKGDYRLVAVSDVKFMHGPQ